MFVFDKVTKYFKVNGQKKYLLKDVNLTIPGRENIAILGRNGAGKSTLMRMIGGIEPLSDGKIISDFSFSWTMGVSSGLQGGMTGRQNVKFVCSIYGKSYEETKDIIKYVLDFSELGDSFDAPIKTYSSGMKGRLTLGLSLAFSFDYYLVDEILSVGDLNFKEKSRKAIEDKIRNNNIIMVSHSTDSLKEFCSVSLVLHEGEMHYYPTVEEGIEHYMEINKIK